jgi:hypothetical protein
MKKIDFIWLLFFSACTPTSPSTSSRWSGTGEKPEIPITEGLLKSEPSRTSAGEVVQMHQQMAAEFRVEGAFVKSVSQKDKGITFQSYVLTKEITPFKILKATRMNLKKDRIWAEFKKSHTAFDKEKLYSPLEIIFTSEPRFKPVLYVLTETPTGLIRSIYINENSELISESFVGSALTDMIESPSFAFTLGPKKGPLSPILVNRKSLPEGLSDSLIEVTSIAPAKITLNGTLEYPTTDERFDQVQAFYFSHQIMNWFNQTLGVRISNSVRILTHLGFPEKTNAAFYFNNQIRLGSGDDVTYSNIAWDPTIVMHETSHAMIDRLSHLPFQGEGGSINEGFADLFTTFYLDSPLLGENSFLGGPFKRTVDQSLKLSEKTGGLYHDSAIVSGFFWNLKKQIGSEKTLNLAMHVLNRLGPNSNFSDFKLSLLEQSQQLFLNEDLNKVNQLMKERELL